MMRVLNPTYQMRVTIKDAIPTSRGVTTQNFNPGIDRSPYKFADPLKGKTGCDEALAAVKDALTKAGLDADVWFEQFSHS